MSIYLGLDSSTQSLTAIAIEVDRGRRAVLFERTLSFDQALPAYGTVHGVLPAADGLVRVAPPLMWAEGLDLMLADVARSGIDLSLVAAVSGSAQQHGSVYLAEGADQILARLDAGGPLADQLAGLFARAVSPIWMDASTATECAAITDAVGGPLMLARLTGSRAFERFSGPQIRKFALTDPIGYARTERVHLVSSFLASLLIGCHAPIDPGDGSGMNLMDIASRQWAAAAVRATAAHLAEKLPPLVASTTIVGGLAPYWRARYGFGNVKVVAWSGDNPCTLVGAGLSQEGRVAISLGTSDTIFGYISEPRVDPSGTGHVFGAPIGGYMGLTCFSNGSLARERIRDAYGLDWPGFAQALHDTPPGTSGVLLPWFEPEITPPVQRPGPERYGLDPGDAAANVRAIVEGQMMAMRRHSGWMGVDIDTIRATGGAAVNREILQVAADVFGADVDQMKAGNTAALGAALRAYHADRRAAGIPITWDEVMEGFAEPMPGSRIGPRREYRATYDALMTRYADCERDALSRLT